MNRVFFSIIFVFIAIAGLMIYQAVRGGTARVYLPSQLIAEGSASDLPRIRVGGRVSADTPIDYKVDPSIELRFSIIDPGSDSGVSVPVVYNGLKPDMFSAGRDVIIDGEFAKGTVIASHLLTQCPSKYEPPLPVTQTEAAAGNHK